MRNSAEARCAVKKYVEDPTDTCFSIQEVFFNVCGLVEADNDADKIKVNSMFCVLGVVNMK